VDVNWDHFPEAGQLLERIAKIAQREYEDSITTAGTLGDAEYLGHRIAAEIFRDAYDMLSTKNERVLVFLEPGEVRA
jgi:hypothetical protein